MSVATSLSLKFSSADAVAFIAFFAFLIPYFLILYLIPEDLLKEKPGLIITLVPPALVVSLSLYWIIYFIAMPVALLRRRDFPGGVPKWLYRILYRVFPY